MCPHVSGLLQFRSGLRARSRKAAPLPLPTALHRIFARRMACFTYLPAAIHSVPDGAEVRPRGCIVSCAMWCGTCCFRFSIASRCLYSLSDHFRYHRPCDASCQSFLQVGRFRLIKQFKAHLCLESCQTCGVECCDESTTCAGALTCPQVFRSASSVRELRAEYRLRDLVRLGFCEPARARGRARGPRNVC